MDKAEKAKELLKSKKEEENNKTVKTSETPKTMTPLERAMALRRKASNKYDSYIMGKFLAGLDK